MKGAEEVRTLVRTLRATGLRSTTRRILLRASERLGTAQLDFPLRSHEIADSTRLSLDVREPVSAGARLSVGWLTTPPGAGSGGHTTMFRMVQALERAGHRCVILVHDRHGGDLDRHTAVIREHWPWVQADVARASTDLDRVDACVATGWPTAHVLATQSTAALHRFYFIQDFEPYFYPRGSEYEIAADTYRFGFTNIALGHMVHDRLHRELDVDSHLVPFSCDTAVYSFQNTGHRSGVVFYTKPGVPRRGYRIGALALQEFHRRHPEQPIHLYGEAAPDIGVPVVHHRRLSPADLNALYNQSIAGVAMSFTNISLVAEEMLAAGCVPVVNDSPDARSDLPNPAVAWTVPTPGAVADTLSRLVESTTVGATARAAADSVRRDNWSATGQQVVDLITSTCSGTVRGEKGGAADRPPFTAG